MNNFREELRKIINNEKWTDNEKFEAIDELHEKYVAEAVKLFAISDVIKNEVAVCEHPEGWIGITERSGEYYCEKCKQNFSSKTVL